MAFFKKEFHQHLADFFWLGGKAGNQPCSAYWPESDGEGLKLRSRNTPRLQTRTL